MGRLHKGCARLKDLTKRLTTRAGDSHAAPVLRLQIHAPLALYPFILSPSPGQELKCKAARRRFL